MKKMIIFLCALAIILGSVSIGFAATVTLLNDDFDTENGGIRAVNYNNFVNWTVSNGTVDLCGTDPWNFLPGNGLYVDLDGSTSDAGLITTKTVFGFEPGYSYELSYDLAGSQRGDTNSVAVSLGSIYNKSFTLNTDDPFQTTIYCFTVQGLTNAALSFNHVGGDNYGILLDNVSITSSPVPIPGSLLLFGSGLIGFLQFGRKLKK